MVMYQDEQYINTLAYDFTVQVVDQLQPLFYITLRLASHYKHQYKTTNARMSRTRAVDKALVSITNIMTPSTHLCIP
jgi:hypothetical protein